MSQINGFLGRRNLLKWIGAAGVSTAVATACSRPQETGAQSQSSASASSPAAQQVAQASPSVPAAIENRPSSWDMTPDQALKLVMDGNQRFVTQKSQHPRQGFARLVETGADQFPFAAFLSCADSRVPVEVVFDQGIGDCFVVRVAGNIATPEAIGSLEFGCAVLGSRMVMVLGHESCGAVNAVLRKQALPAESKIGTLVPYIEPGVKLAAKETGNDLVNAIKDNVRVQVETLKKSPILSGLIQKGELKIVGAYYDLDQGTVELLKS
jgi:carbonic anhydrase